MLGSLTHPTQVIASCVVLSHCEKCIVGGLTALSFGDVLHGVAEQPIVEFGVIVELAVGLAGHESYGKLWDFVRLVIQGRAIDLLNGRIVHYEIDEIEYNVGEEEGKEEERAYDGFFSGYGFILWKGKEGEEVDGPKHPHTHVRLRVLDE